MIPNNSIVSYQGGGYEGCFWEYNYAFVDERGEFHNIYASGCNGCESLEELATVKDDRRTTIYRADSPEDLQELSRKECVRGVMQVAEFFDRHFNDFGIAIPLRCEKCGCSVEFEDACPGDYAGAGGVMYLPTKILCHDCEEELECH